MFDRDPQFSGDPMMQNRLVCWVCLYSVNFKSADAATLAYVMHKDLKLTWFPMGCLRQLSLPRAISYLDNREGIHYSQC